MARRAYSESSAWERVRETARKLSNALPTYGPGGRELSQAQRMVQEIQESADQMLQQLAGGIHENPPLLVWANPPGPHSGGILSKRVYEIRYKHAEDGQDYKHPFAPGVWLFTHDKAPGQVTLWQHDGKPLFQDF